MKVCWAWDGHILRAAWQCLHVAWHVGMELRIFTFLHAHSLLCLPCSQESSENLLPQRKHFLLTLSSLLKVRKRTIKIYPTKRLLPVDTLYAKIITTLVASVPILSCIQHISTNLRTALNMVYWHFIYWKTISINSPALYHNR